MAEQNDSTLNLKDVFQRAETLRKQLDLAPSTSSASYQDQLHSALVAYRQAADRIDNVDLYSRNETIEDVSSSNLQYFLVWYHLGDLSSKNYRADRRDSLIVTRKDLERFLRQLDDYDILSKTDAAMWETYQEDPNGFSTASKTDAAARRQAKIARFREEKDLKNRLNHLQTNPTALANDEIALRDLHLTNIRLHTHLAFQTLESIAQEFEMLAMASSAATAQQQSPSGQNDSRERHRIGDGYSERLDKPLSELLAGGRAGPILSKDGRPLRPFTLLDSRQRLQDDVFRPDHSLPTMSIDEYLEEERRRGGIIEGGGEASLRRPEINEDDHDRMDQETLKQRKWDDYKDDNPRGIGNTMNMG